MNSTLCDQCFTDITDLPQYPVMLEMEDSETEELKDVEVTLCRPCAKEVGAI
jgi:hypothetical protein